MASYNLSFKLDAGKILAKLHRGACQVYPDMLFFNTGIINDQKIPPENVEASDMDFDII